jgi:hypothetical protein
MTPDSVHTILVKLERVFAAIEKQDEVLGEIKGEVKKTNGRVTNVEIRERERAAIEAFQAAQHKESDHRSEKWKNILPLVISSTVATIAASVFILLITGQL